MKDKNRKRRRPFDDPFGFFDEEFIRMSEMMERLFDQAMRDREDMEPFIYGFSVRTGPDGIPIFRRFGDAFRPGEKIEKGLTREPLTDVIERGDSVSVTVEMPGVEKEDIDVDIRGNELTIKAETPERRYHKVVELPCKVDEDSVRATFKNGVLDINLAKTEESKSRKIRIE